MPQLRIFCYMPSPRVWKAKIAARLSGVDLEIRSAAPAKLKDWLWDFDARPLTEEDKDSDRYKLKGRTGFKGNVLHKTDKFLAAHPFGTVPAAFSPDGKIGIFESNSIMRAVARIATNNVGLYGGNPYLASRIDSFLDASLVFARDSQIYLLSLTDKETTQEIYNRASQAFSIYMSAIERALASNGSFLVGDKLTLADICFACEYAMFARERRCSEALNTIGAKPISSGISKRFPRAIEHFKTLCRHEAFSPELGTIVSE
tara:strand:+ start:2945 stop:3724 length:780 start_codon:yes stop_codon:yes gene_type:complete